MDQLLWHGHDGLWWGPLGRKWTHPGLSSDDQQVLHFMNLFANHLFYPHVCDRFRELGKRVFYVTNNSTKHRKEYKTKLDKLGFGGDMVMRLNFLTILSTLNYFLNLFIGRNYWNSLSGSCVSWADQFRQNEACLCCRIYGWVNLNLMTI